MRSCGKTPVRLVNSPGRSTWSGQPVPQVIEHSVLLIYLGFFVCKYVCSFYYCCCFIFEQPWLDSCMLLTLGVVEVCALEELLVVICAFMYKLRSNIRILSFLPTKRIRKCLKIWVTLFRFRWVIYTVLHTEIQSGQCLFVTKLAKSQYLNHYLNHWQPNSLTNHASQGLAMSWTKIPLVDN